MTTAITSLALSVPDSIAPAGSLIRVRGTREQPLFSIPDTCRALGMTGKNAAANIIGRLGIEPSFPSNRGKTPTGGRPSTYADAYCAEPDWYDIITSSRTPTGKAFRAWVYGEVLPSIRLHGQYPPPANPVPAIRPWTYRFQVRPELNAHRLLLRRTHPGRWTVVVAMLTDMALLEGELVAHGYPLSVSDLPDGSAGQCYVNYRKGKPWALDVTKGVPLVLPAGGDRRYPRAVMPNVYRAEERHHFEEWFEDVYAPANLPAYLRRKARGMGPDARPAAIEAAERVCGRLALAGPCGERQGSLFGEGV